MEFLVAGAERVYTENGRLQSLSHWSYKILARSQLASYRNPPLLPSDRFAQNFSKGAGYIDFCTWHRYSDFEWLAVHVDLEFPGILFPPIPPKETEGTMDKLQELLSTSKDSSGGGETATEDNPLVKKRMRQLQLTLNVIALLSEIHESDIFKAFVTLEEPAWCAFKEEQEKKKKTSVFSAVKSKGLSLFSKLRALTETNEENKTEASPFDFIASQQRDMGELLNTCFVQMENIERFCTSEVHNWNERNALVKHAQGSHLPWTACYCGHIVQDARHPELEGVVKSIDANSVKVQWNGESNNVTTIVALEDLNYPSSGISDPAVLALQEFIGQIDSYSMHLSRSPDVVVLRDLEDMMWFLSSYSSRCVSTIKRLKGMSSQLNLLTKTSEKDSSGEKAERLERMKLEVSTAMSRFTSQYNNFYRPFMKSSLLEVAHKIGEMMTRLITDDDWKNRLLKVDSLLKIPPSVLPTTGAEE